MKRHTFTLVELLVVVGIIALLAGLIIPAVGMAQTSARRTACLSNQGQVMKIMRTYMNEGDHQFLPNWYYNSNTYVWTQALHSAGKLQNDMTVFRCPSILSVSSPTIANVSSASLREAYGMIYSNIENKSDTRATRQVIGISFKGSQALRFTNGTTTGSNHRDDDYMVAANQLTLGGCSASLDTNRDQVVAKALINFNQGGNNDDIGRPALVHGGQTNNFFLDGHAESLTRTALYQKTKYFSQTWFNESKECIERDAVKVAHGITKEIPDKAKDDWMIDPDTAAVNN